MRVGFAARLAFAMAGLIVTACFALSWLLLRRNSEELASALHDRGTRIATILAHEAELSVLSGNLEALRQLGRSTTAERDVVYVHFLDASGQTLVSLGDETTGPLPPPRFSADRDAIESAPGIWELQAPILTADAPVPREELGFLGEDVQPARRARIGTVAVGITRASLAEYRAHAVRTTLFFAAIVVIAAILLAMVVAKAITRPLRALAGAADAIAQGSFGTSVPVRGHDEVATLAASFNNMAERLASSRAALEDQNRALEEKVRARTQRLETVNRELEEASRLRSEFMATVSHELRTPLNVILGYTEMLASGDVGTVNDEQGELLHAIRRYSKMQLDLVNDVLDFSRLASGRMTFNVERFTLDVLLAEVAALHGASTGDKPVVLQVEAEPGIEELETDRMKLLGVIRNLVDNALKFTAVGTVEVRGFRASRDDAFVVEVRDTGRGIPPEELPHVFEEFRQVGTAATRNTGGVGLGLAIVKRLVQALGGTIEVTSRFGEGSTFRVEIPRSLLRARTSMTSAA
jgi:signal transduction histidine kinase